MQRGTPRETAKLRCSWARMGTRLAAGPYRKPLATNHTCGFVNRAMHVARARQAGGCNKVAVRSRAPLEALQRISRLRLLFIPVSAPMGRGEYERSRLLASATKARWPHAEIRFILNENAPYAREVPFAATLLPSSATFHTPEVARVIEDFEPDVVIFDNAGRTRQLEAAKDSGARIIYISSRLRQRRKAFRASWMRLVDEHWIAWPEFIAGSLSMTERLKLRFIGAPTVRYMDAMLPQGPVVPLTDDYVLVVPGGGTGHRGTEDAPGLIAAAASLIAHAGHSTLLIGPSKPANSNGKLHHSNLLDMPDLTSMIRGARLVVTNGGDTLLQTLACRKLCVATPIAHDQTRRIERCAAAGLVTRAELSSEGVSRAALSLLADPHRQSAQLANLTQRPIENRLDDALDAISRLAHVS